MLPDISLEQLRTMMRKNEVTLLLVKELAANDNAKNQLYLGGSMEVANIVPMGDIRAETTVSGNRSLKAPVPLFWLQSDGSIAAAPNAQIILYPQYPEARLSGFLRGAINAPNHLLNNRAAGRFLFLGITSDQKIIGWASGPDELLSKQYRSLKGLEQTGVFAILPLSERDVGTTTGDQLLRELLRIHGLGWINSKALNSDGQIKPCISSHCVGYTLEAELGVPRNGRSEPDYKGWEIKAGLVGKFGVSNSKPVTLMTPEPTGGYYRSHGVESFIRKFGYEDKLGRLDRLNFGGIFRANERHPSTKLTLQLDGFDTTKGRITNPEGSIVLLTDSQEVAAQWSFAALMTLWKRKHAQAAYVPAQTRQSPKLQYCYDSVVRFGTGTDFPMLLNAIARGIVIQAALDKTKKPVSY
jgi:hypothetical protein